GQGQFRPARGPALPQRLESIRVPRTWDELDRRDSPQKVLNLVRPEVLERQVAYRGRNTSEAGPGTKHNDPLTAAAVDRGKGVVDGCFRDVLLDRLFGDRAAAG